MDRTIFGIDLGTTYSCIAYVDEYGRPAMIPNEDNVFTTPSVVLFESETNHVVGRQARRQAIAMPEDTCELVKRHMGDAEWAFSAHDKQWSAPAVSSLIISVLADNARQNTGADVREVVITVPAYFGDERRKATKLAGELAHLEVVDIINEPMAAAFSYGFAQAEAGNEETVLVYDLGGGTFDTTVIQIAEKKIATVATDGDHELGGADWDRELARYVAGRFMEECPDAEDPLDDDHSRQNLMSDVEEQKRALSQRESVDFIVLNGGDKAAFPVTREQFEEITSGLLEQTIDITRRVLAAARAKGVATVDRVLLVGGSSRMPAVRRRLEQEFGFPVELKDPDLAVAKGAALYGRKKLIEGIVWETLTDSGEARGGAERELGAVDQAAKLAAVEAAAEQMGISAAEAGMMVDTVLGNVCSRGFGPGALFPGPDGRLEERVVFLCHQNENLPLEKRREFYTNADNQSLIHVAVYEQGGSVESERPEDNKVIVEGDISNIPHGYPKNTPISVVMRMDTDGMIRLTAYHPGAAEPLTLDARGATESPENVEEARMLVAGTTRR
ncbi:MAG TPA: Hsp70 family protein [Streptosporangiaceae bacterium]